MASLRKPSFPKPTGAGLVNLKPSLRMQNGGDVTSVYQTLRQRQGLGQGMAQGPSMADYGWRGVQEVGTSLRNGVTNATNKVFGTDIAPLPAPIDYGGNLTKINQDQRDDAPSRHVQHWR